MEWIKPDDPAGSTRGSNQKDTHQKKLSNRARSFIELKLLAKPVSINIVLANESLEASSFSSSIK